MIEKVTLIYINETKLNIVSCINIPPKITEKQSQSEFDDEEVYQDEYNFYGNYVNEEKYLMRHPYWIKISYYFSEKVDPNHHKV